MVVEVELEKLKRFSQFLRSEDRVIFDDLLNQCRLYASYGSTMASPVKAIPLLMSMIFGQHKRLMELEKRISFTNPSGFGKANSHVAQEGPRSSRLF
jgi:hypothetical protein